MSSKYVPPAMRKKEQPSVAPPPPPPEKKYEDEFPSLAPTPTTRRVWGGTTTFAEKAREWSEHADREAKELELRKKTELESQTRSTVRVLPRFHNIRRFVEEEEEPEKEEMTKSTTSNDEESGWTLVERKVRKKRKTLSEIADEEFAKESEEENSDSVWDNDEKALHETCWDERV